jgi:hypothetical protein
MSDTLRFYIPGELTALNEYIGIERTPRYGRAMAADTKKRETERVRLQALELPAVKKYPVRIAMTWYCPDQKHDPDNIAFAKKFVLDGLVRAGVLKQDGWKQIKGFTDDFEIDATNPGVEVVIITA